MQTSLEMRPSHCVIFRLCCTLIGWFFLRCSNGDCIGFLVTDGDATFLLYPFLLTEVNVCWPAAFIASLKKDCVGKPMALLTRRYRSEDPANTFRPELFLSPMGKKKKKWQFRHKKHRSITRTISLKDLFKSLFYKAAASIHLVR